MPSAFEEALQVQLDKETGRLESQLHSIDVMKFDILPDDFADNIHLSWKYVLADRTAMRVTALREAIGELEK